MIPYMTTLANGIIGVSVLAMPYCFKQCGIILASMMLLVSSVLSRLACHFLIKSATMSRRRNYEFLAFHAFGNMGKILVELFTIGFLLGTCIAYFVVIGDLGPEILSKIVDKHPQDIRTSLLISSAVFIVFPLGLLKNIDSLSSVCTATIIFYIILVIKVISESMTHVLSEDWFHHVHYWRPAGILQCIPIFSMALFCQTQLFEIYDTIPNATLDKMNEVVKGALNICTSVYLCVGFFGYIAFCTKPFTGNILMSFEPSLTSEAMKIGFVFSVAFSFPLVVFPCRSSLNSLLYRRVAMHDSLNYMPETRFKCLTLIIVSISLLIGCLIPNIEFVLGLLGSTTGVMICLIFPATFFISINNKNTNETILAHLMIVVGILILTLGTYANLYALEESASIKVFVDPPEFQNQILHSPLNIPGNLMIIPDKKEIKVETNSKDAETKFVERIDEKEKPKQLKDDLVVKVEDVNKETRIKANNKMKNSEGENTDESKLKVVDKVVDKPKIADTNNINGNNLINSDAIQKEELELAAEAEVKKQEDEKLRETLKKYKQEQIKILKETKEILQDIKEQKKEWEKAVHQQAEGDKKGASSLNQTNNDKQKKVKDHILGALTKGMTLKNQSSDKLPNSEKKLLPIPIVHQMINQTQQGNISDGKSNLTNQHEREKRDAEIDINKTSDVEHTTTQVSDTDEKDSQSNICIKKNNLSKDDGEPQFNVDNLIETASLSLQQEFTNKPEAFLRIQKSTAIKKRDLKAFSVDKK